MACSLFENRTKMEVEAIQFFASKLNHKSATSSSDNFRIAKFNFDKSINSNLFDFFCYIPWFKSLVTYVSSLLRLRSTLILSKIMTLAFELKSIEVYDRDAELSFGDLSSQLHSAFDINIHFFRTIGRKWQGT